MAAEKGNWEERKKEAQLLLPPEGSLEILKLNTGVQEARGRNALTSELYSKRPRLHWEQAEHVCFCGEGSLGWGASQAGTRGS